MLQDKLLFQNLFYRPQTALFARRDNRDGNTCGRSPSGSSAPMDILLYLVRQIVIEHMGQVVHIQTSGRHIGSHQKLEVLETEPAHRIVALRLGKIPMQGIGIVPILDQLFGHLLGLAPGPAENDGIDIRVKVDNPLQGQVAILGIDHVVMMGHIGRTLVLGPNRHLLRLMHVMIGYLTDFLRHRSREKPSMLVFRRVFQNAVQLVPETHVEHLVGLIEHHRMQMAEIDFAPAQDIQHTPRRGHDDFHAPGNLVQLAFYAGATVNGANPQIGNILGKILQILGYLHAEFPCRTQHQGFDSLVLGIALFNQGKAEGRCLSCPGLGQGDHIGLCSQKYGQDLSLYRHGF